MEIHAPAGVESAPLNVAAAALHACMHATYTEHALAADSVTGQGKLVLLDGKKLAGVRRKRAV